jgi:hypothetical protein
VTTAKRTTLVRVLNLSIGYEQDISPATVAGAILEALEAGLVDEMGIVFVKAEETLTIYAPMDEVRVEEAETSNPPETPKVCPDCDVGSYDEDVGFELCADCKRKPNL